MTHPLTDKMLYEMSLKNWDTGFTDDNMRSAADWQLEQVIEWLQGNLGMYEGDDLGYKYIFIDKDKLITDLKNAMRPQQQEDN